MPLDQTSWPSILEKTLRGEHLLADQAQALMEAWLKEDLSAVQTGAFLAALRSKGVNGEELASMAKVLRSACVLPCERPDISMVDTCGTGGDGAETFNISTAVGFTAAACGVNVAKHGNRSASGKVGSADVLEGLGINLKAPLQQVVAALSRTGVTFLFAPAWHPALVNLAPLRRSLGVRTVFNLLGPLVNPLRPQSQVLGVARAELLDPMAEALCRLGLNRAVVVYGAGGLDEASLEGISQLRFVENGQIKESSIDPLKLGLSNASSRELKGGDVALNQEILETALKGGGTRAQKDVIALNTSLVLWAAGLHNDVKSGLDVANQSLAEGRPWEKLQQLRLALD
ncbi:anthranilate phosphoribosyltransferase [Prochlorococcus sp. MIT 1300]|uniref:anthranilate phosphoribosyltransferase n=1 Tax=Prochlorococcus sp. MIT 1300 TaxID=3096218 RepID=UPI002A74E600|nr:anthranilate phosphoribosyltransferase [Prochlorococcus sp. MIT 1300]